MLSPQKWAEKKHKKELKRRRYRQTLKGIARSEFDHNKVKYRNGLPYQQAPVHMVAPHKHAVQSRVAKTQQAAQKRATLRREGRKV